MFDGLIVHSAELCLKGDNRHFFEERLASNIRKRLGSADDIITDRQHASLIIRHRDGALSDEMARLWAERIRTVMGMANARLFRSVPKDLEAIKVAAIEFVRASGAPTFKITARRSDKSFPIDSMTIASEVGGAVLDALPDVKVDVRNPKQTIYVEVSQQSAYISPDIIAGASGLPVGSSGRVVTLLSGGIDSPVAAWKMLRRGCEIVYVHCHSYPFVGRESLEKVRRLAEALAQFQPGARLYNVAIGEFQRDVAAKCDPALRIILYRRMMMRCAARVAEAVGAQGIVTGDSVGQVASQTLENLAVVSAATSLPIYRPLIGDNKDDIVNIGRLIGTYDTSIEPHDDCCSVFMPPRPAIRAKLDDILAAEAALDIDAAVQKAIDTAEVVPVIALT